MDYPIWKQRVSGINWSEAQDVGASDRTVRRAKDIPDYTADTGIRTTERLHCTRMVMGFALDSERRAGSELQNPSVANESTYNISRIDLGRCATKLVQERDNFITSCGGDPCAKRLVGAVFRPRLRDHF